VLTSKMRERDKAIDAIRLTLEGRPLPCAA